MKKLSETYKELKIAFTLPIQIKNAKGNITYYEGNSGCWWRSEYNDNGNQTFYENSSCWWRSEYDDKGNKTFHENSSGLWKRKEYDDDGNETYYENSDGFWERREYDTSGKETYFEHSNGTKDGTPRNSHAVKVIKLNGKRYQLID